MHWLRCSLEAGRYSAAFFVRKKLGADVCMRAGCRIAVLRFAVNSIGSGLLSWTHGGGIYKYRFSQPDAGKSLEVVSNTYVTRYFPEKAGLSDAGQCGTCCIGACSRQVVRNRWDATTQLRGPHRHITKHVERMSIRSLSLPR